MGSVLPAPLTNLRIETASTSGFVFEQMGLRSETDQTFKLWDGGSFSTQKGEYVRAKQTVADSNGVGVIPRVLLDNGGGNDDLVEVNLKPLPGPAALPTGPYRAPWLDDMDRLREQEEARQQGGSTTSSGGSIGSDIPTGNVGDGGANFYWNPDEIQHQPLWQPAPETGSAPTQQSTPTETAQPTNWWWPVPVAQAPVEGCETVEYYYTDPFSGESGGSIISHNAGGGSWNQVN